MTDRGRKEGAGIVPREKVLRHLRTVAVAGASLIACKGAGCGGSRGAPPPVVCDPLPPPINCDAVFDPSLASAAIEAAAWVMPPSSGPRVGVSLGVGVFAGLRQVHFSDDVRVDGAEVLSLDVVDTGLRLECRPPDGGGDFTLAATLTCDRKHVAMTVHVAVPANPVVGQKLEAKLTATSSP